MRYLLAMIGAVATALACTLFLASPVANWVVARQAFENPDAVNAMHSTVFLAVNILALLAGWALGWVIGRQLERKPEPH